MERYYRKMIPRMAEFVKDAYHGIDLGHVEVKVELEGKDQPVRYATFDDLDPMLRNIKRLDLGPAYSIPLYPGINSEIPDIQTRITQTPLKLDFDFKERNCCGKSSACKVCLRGEFRELMLNVDEQFQNLRHQWFFSGGKGLHLWVLDPVTSIMSETHREEFLNDVMSLCDRKWCQVFDKEVTVQIGHCLRMPYSLHDGCKRAVLPVNNLADENELDLLLEEYKPENWAEEHSKQYFETRIKK